MLPTTGHVAAFVVLMAAGAAWVVFLARTAARIAGVDGDAAGAVAGLFALGFAAINMALRFALGIELWSQAMPPVLAFMKWLLLGTFANGSLLVAVTFVVCGWRLPLRPRLRAVGVGLMIALLLDVAAFVFVDRAHPVGSWSAPPTMIPTPRMPVPPPMPFRRGSSSRGPSGRAAQVLR
jgi:hypothetical protein